MHTDEAVNAYLVGAQLAGESYRYDPEDRHGPLLYWVARPVAQLGGATSLSDLTETQLRLTPVVVGCVTVLLFGAAVELFGFLPCLVAALLFAVGPLPVYYNRYFIHETLFVAATFGLIIMAWKAVNHQSLSAAVWVGLCAAAMLACKETAGIHFFALLVAASVWVWTDASHRRPVAGETVSPGQTTARRLLVTRTLPIAFGVFVLASVLIFSGFGHDWSALSDLLRAVRNFAARAGGQGHEKPFGYYFSILDSRFVFFVVAAAGVWRSVRDARAGTDRAGLGLAVYGILILLTYSCIPYKTPWLALNLWLPLALLCGLGVDWVWHGAGSRAGRWIAVAVSVGLLVLAGSETWKWVFKEPAPEDNPLAYAHTTEGIVDLPQRIDTLCRQRGLTQPRIAVVAADPWPLPWYLRRFSETGYWQPGQDVGNADLYITSTDAAAGLARRLEGFRPEYFGVRPNVLLILWTPPAAAPVE